MENDNFITKCISGEASVLDIDDYIDLWHNRLDDEESLASFLGFNVDEYRMFIHEHHHGHFKAIAVSICRHMKENKNK